MAPAIPLALLLGLMSFHGAFNALLGVLSLLFGALLAAFLFTGGLQFLIDFAFVGLGFDHWRVAVTDQRVLLQRGIPGTGHDEMQRHDLDICVYDRAEGKIVLTGAGRELAIDCIQRQAGRILAALGYDDVGC